MNKIWKQDSQGCFLMLSLSVELLQTHISRLYGFILAAIGLASTLHHAFLYDATHPLNFYLTFFIVIYFLAILMLGWLLVWFHQRKRKDDTAPISRSNTFNNFGEGFNLYLKGGVILFTFVSIVYNILRITHLFHTGFMSCGGPGYLIFCLSQASFLVLTAALFTLHDRVVIQEPTLLVRLIFTHLLVCCLCTWFHAGIGEIREGLQNEMKKKQDKYNSSSFPYPDGTEKCEVHEDIIDITRPYMLPVMVELALLAAPMMYDFLDRMEEENPNQKRTTEFASYPKLHKSKRGLMIGAFVILISIVLIITLYSLESFNPAAALAVYYTQGIIYSILALIVAILTYFKLRPLRLHPSEGTTVDRNILWMSFFGSLVFSFLHVAASCYTLNVHVARHDDIVFRCVDLANALLSLLDMCLQSLVILNTMHRVVRHYTDVEQKPGRGHIALLLCINLSLWIIHTFEVKKATALEIATEKAMSPYLSATYALQHVALPLVVLFRFHSTVCLSSAWSRAFEEEMIVEYSVPT